ncbi:heme peroxidase [Motilibacter rhizosphaerae]|uniref:Heme peroxidase n=1 Tax=Motilibacter rhizosphaerae TaxID=598652 RepID=A0A4Q7NGU2_9ACTN|nr:peroxidase family protein [Motilibacter rhizosphaerae]RZS82666.1 heme peroxidase [Motilibacter rhizosphaerae]
MATTRREFLTRAGLLGAAGAVSGSTVGVPGMVGTAAAAGCPYHAKQPPLSATFGRIFPGLPAFADDSPSLRQALLEIGAPGGMLDAKDDLFGPDGGPVKLITDPALSAVNRNNPTHTAGVTFLGQFIDHDLTFDATSKLGVAADPTVSPNGRTPRLDLDSVYGGGPMMQAELYDKAHPAKLLLESGGLFEDLPRRADSSPVIADFRNDTNLMISGLHAAFAKFHNNAVDTVAGPGTPPIDAFVEARRLTTWHYQWLVLHQFLPLVVGQATVDGVRASCGRSFRPDVQAFVPVEWSGAAFRFGHSMVRPSYRANLAGDGGQPFFGLIFDPRLQVADGEQLTSEPDDLRGGYRAPRRFVGWQTFFDFGGAYTAAVRPNKLIDTVLSTPLFTLPPSAVAHLPGDVGPLALPQRTLLRHLTWSLPSGQRLARRFEVPVLSRGDLADVGGYGHGLDTSTPLWLYILREAQVVNGGRFLGPVGGRIVAEVLIGLLEADPTSYLNVQPDWQPTLGATGGDYTMAQFLTFAGVDPASRGQ